MNTIGAKRITRELSPEEEERLKRQREQIAKELPDLAKHDRMRKEAQEEMTLTGALRRAIHASPISLASLAAQAGISTIVLDEFLTGERTLPSDVIDKLVAALGLCLLPIP